MLPEPPPERTHHDSNPRHRPPTRSHPSGPLGSGSQGASSAAWEIQTLQIARRSLDARKKERIQWVYTVDVTVSAGRTGPSARAAPRPVPPPSSAMRSPTPSMPPGSGLLWRALARQACLPRWFWRRPAFGLWSWNGGRDAASRHRLVEEFWQTGRLDPGAMCSSERAAPGPSPTES